ncbi:MAG: ATP-binding protein [Planctomycetes bacterium]|nr:ATP-binding protein [Planctomycetota bacterium]
MNDQILEAIRQKLGDGNRSTLADLTPRELDTARIPGKVHAVIGMRRAGKTTFLKQCLAARAQEGVARERLVYFNFEDERLVGLDAKNLGVILEEFYRAHPSLRHEHRVTFCFDEIQLVPGWERFVRRVLDSEEVEILISGSSAKMLSREVASSMRGRAVEALVTPFSFREFGRAAGLSPEVMPLPSARDTSGWTACFDDYLRIGGFPELSNKDLLPRRVELLQGYAEAVVFRDVAERHGVNNLVALRAFVRQLLRQPASMLSITKLHADFRSRGIAVAKQALLEWLGHLEDAFLLFTVPIAARSERQRQVNLRKLYAVDHGLAAAFRVRSAQDLGHDLENVVACELLRRGCELAYVRTTSGHEVDFLATTRDGERHLVQVAARAFDPTTLDRELRSLDEAAVTYRDARQWLLLGEPLPAGTALPKRVTPMPVWRWLLDREGDR